MFIVEGVAGIYHYHLSETGKNGQPAICGKNAVMHTELKLDSWGNTGHLEEQYCEECANLAPEGIIPKKA